MKKLEFTKDGWAIGITKVESPNSSKMILKPELCVCHWTGGLRAAPTIRWMLNRKSKVSAHFVIDRTGSITQLVSVKRKAWHAGKSSWKGRPSVNSFSIGIELVSVGPVQKDRNGIWRSRRGQPVMSSDVLNGHHNFSPEQRQSLDNLVASLMLAYPSITAITDHKTVSPGRKIDIGPLIDLKKYNADRKAAVSRYRAVKLFDNEVLKNNSPIIRWIVTRFANIWGGVSGRYRKAAAKRPLDGFEPNA